MISHLLDYCLSLLSGAIRRWPLHLRVNSTEVGDERDSMMALKGWMDIIERECYSLKGREGRLIGDDTEIRTRVPIHTCMPIRVHT